MIAIHSALYIFKPRVANGEGGLYPYRNIAYAVWLILPLIMASLAFINKDLSYVSEGTYCYLPVRPFWYRLALGWIPRYIIFLVILGVYVSIYYYVRYKFQGFTRIAKNQTDGAGDSSEDSNKPLRRFTLHGPPPTPELSCHGLIPGYRQDSGISPPRVPKKSLPAVETISPATIKTPGSAHRFMWENLIAAEDPNYPMSPSLDSASLDSEFTVSPISPQPPSRPRTPFFASQLDGPDDSTALHISIAPVPKGTDLLLSPDPTTERADRLSIVDIFTALEREPRESDIAMPVNQVQPINTQGQSLATSEMLKTRDKIRRQLRFLFIYPLVYMGMWILPFASHVMQYDDKYALNPPFGLTVVTTICICSQAAVDCWLFSSREQPWKHIPGTDGSFLVSLKFWTGWTAFVKRTKISGPGKTSEEMVREARAAYRRRDEEMAQQRFKVGQALSTGSPGGRKVEKSWWEDSAQIEALVGEISPGLEQSNPMDIAVTEDGSSTSPKKPSRPDKVHFKEPGDGHVVGEGSVSRTIPEESQGSSSRSPST